MKKRLYFIIISGLILALSILLSFLLNKSLAINGDDNITLYWIVKAVVGLSLVFAIIYVAFKKQDISHAIIIFYLSVLLQFLPLVVRLLLRASEPKYVLSIIISSVIYIVYLSVMFGFSILTDKTNQADEKLLGKSIKVIDEDEYNDGDGNFKSANNKVNK